jgi:hypothetical protein
LDQVECGPAIRQHAAEFTVEIGAPRRQCGNSAGDGWVLDGPVIAAAGQELHLTRVEPGVHAIPIELDFMQPVGAFRCLFNKRCQLRLDPFRQHRAQSASVLPVAVLGYECRFVALIRPGPLSALASLHDCLMHASPVEHRIREDDEASVVALASRLLGGGINAGGKSEDD